MVIFHHFRNALLSAAANGSLSETNDKPSIPIKAAPLQQNNRLKVTMQSRPQESFLTPLKSPKSSPLGPQKVKNDHKIKSKSNVRIEGNIENESCSTT